MIGLARKAGKVSVGSTASFAAVTNRSANAGLLAVDAGGNTSKKFRDKCAFYNIPLLEVFSKEELGRACGRNEATLVTVNDPGFAAKLIEYSGEN
ncbi:ribosomal L7Ae/L30e/S12e/Gadd45 family protein [Alicyclobacillus sp. SO9]|nr:ribosomal L7Ae/L30e/S12e/Gadd45 family protein [Alicyclobacillus sp. SO9]